MKRLSLLSLGFALLLLFTPRVYASWPNDEFPVTTTTSQTTVNPNDTVTISAEFKNETSNAYFSDTSIYYTIDQDENNPVLTPVGSTSDNKGVVYPEGSVSDTFSLRAVRGGSATIHVGVYGVISTPGAGGSSQTIFANPIVLTVKGSQPVITVTPTMQPTLTPTVTPVPTLTPTPTAQPLIGYVMRPGEVKHFPKYTMITGDVKVNGKPYYDNDAKSGLVVGLEKDADIEAPWGAYAVTLPTDLSLTAATEVAHAAVKLGGCNGGCSTVLISYFLY